MEQQVQEIFVEDIIPNRFQPRLTFDEKALQELSDSIKVHGVLQPLTLRKVGNKYEIVAGERRYKASCLAGLKKVPAIVREMTDNESAEIALIENVQRKNLSSIEEAQSYRNLLDRGYLTQEELAKKIGVAQSTIANKMRLLNLCDEVQNALLNEQISERHARSLLQLTNPDEQKMMLNRIIKERLTVKQLDNEIKKLLEGGSQNGSDEENGGGTMVPNVEENKTETGVAENNAPIMPNKNLFGISVEPPTDLEKSAPNLDIGIDTSVPPVSFNPFSGPVTSDLDNDIPPMTPISNDNIATGSTVDEQIETFDMFGDIVTPEPEKSANPDIALNPFGGITSTVEPEVSDKKSIGDEISSIRETVKKAEADGFKIEMEEYDLEDLYQIIVKIKK